MKKVSFMDILDVDDRLKEKVRQWRNKTEVRKAMIAQHIITKDEHCNWIESLRKNNACKFWVVFFKDVPIGAAYFSNIKYRELISEWGFYIGENEYRGKGLSKMILFRLLEIFFDEMQFKILFTKVLSKNIIAVNLYKKFGFREKYLKSSESLKDISLFEFSKDEWRKNKKRFKDEIKYK